MKHTNTPNPGEAMHNTRAKLRTIGCDDITIDEVMSVFIDEGWRPAPQPSGISGQLAQPGGNSARECWVLLNPKGEAIGADNSSEPVDEAFSPKQDGFEWVRMVPASVDRIGRAWNALADAMHILNGATGSTPKDNSQIIKAYTLVEEAHGIIQRSFNPPAPHSEVLPPESETAKPSKCKHKEDPVDCIGCYNDRHEARVQAAFKYARSKPGAQVEDKPTPCPLRDDALMLDALFKVLPGDEVEVEQGAWERIRTMLPIPPTPKVDSPATPAREGEK